MKKLFCTLRIIYFLINRVFSLNNYYAVNDPVTTITDKRMNVAFGKASSFFPGMF